MELTDIQKQKLDDIYSAAIATAVDDIAHERAWANGSPDEQTAQTHLDNAEELEEWSENLETIKDCVGRVPPVSLSNTQKAWLDELYDFAIRDSEDDEEWIEILEELKDGVQTL